MEFDYERATRHHYQDADRARRYHSRFTAKGWRRLRGRFVAHRERETLRRMLAYYMPGVVLDLPCGTGKMAPVLAEFAAEVVSADISDEMIAVAREEYARLGFDHVEFCTCDAETISEVLEGRHIDVACCIRLLHRVPKPVRKRIMAELARTAPVEVISFGVASPIHRLRSKLLRKKGATVDQVTRRQFEEELREHFTIVDERPIARGICSEWFFLARARRRPEGAPSPPPDGPADRGEETRSWG